MQELQYYCRGVTLCYIGHVGAKSLASVAPAKRKRLSYAGWLRNNGAARLVVPYGWLSTTSNCAGRAARQCNMAINMAVWLEIYQVPGIALAITINN